MDYYIDEIQDYLETLCEKHVDVAHNVNAQRSFARFESHEHISQIQNNGGRNIVVVADYYGQRIGDIEAYKLRMNLQLFFCVKKEAGTGDVTSEINNAIKKSEQILFDFLVRMEKDFRDNDCGPLRGLEPEKARWNKIDGQPWLDDYYGWELNIPFRSTVPVYNPAKWID